MAVRAAVLIAEHAAKRSTPTDAIRLPEYSWQQVLRLKQLLVQAEKRGWQRAQKALFRDLARTLRHFRHELESAVQQVETHRKPPYGINPSEVYQDILALQQEFDDLEIDLANHELAVTTDTIVLEGIDLGPFQIRLDWTQIGSVKQPYRVVAIDPHPAARHQGVTHPHVQDECLCEGDGRAAIANALANGRLYDFFAVISQLLHTYGKGNAFVELDKWDGILCDECGDNVDEEDRYLCQVCGNSLCPSCAGCCPKCQETSCSQCLRPCAACGEDHCTACLRPCSGCRNRVCDDSLQDGLCQACYQKTHEENYHDWSADELPCECQEHLLPRQRLPQPPAAAVSTTAR
jgi:hypothetical protein